jgi:hypothetical protein
VRLSRHACASPELANSSRAALALLQREYGHTAAAQGTQYWHPGR